MVPVRSWGDAVSLAPKESHIKEVLKTVFTNSRATTMPNRQFFAWRSSFSALGTKHKNLRCAKE
jgi:hypothetical protein